MISHDALEKVFLIILFVEILIFFNNFSFLSWFDFASMPMILSLFQESVVDQTIPPDSWLFSPLVLQGLSCMLNLSLLGFIFMA